MGNRKPENWSAKDWRWACEGVSAAITNRWDVTAQCRSCGVRLRVNLWLIAAMRGPGFSLWNQVTPCRVAGCRGVMAFWARPPEIGQPFEMRADRTPGAPR